MRLLNRVAPFLLLAAGPVIVGALPPPKYAEGIFATLLSLAMLAPLSVVTKNPGRARRGSIVDGADRRRPWLIALGTTLFVLLLRAIDGPEPTARTAMLVAGGGMLWLLSLDARALFRLGRGLAGAERLRVRTADSPPIDAGTTIYDFGLGDDELEELAPAAAMYRERERVVRVVRGSQATARRAMLHGVVFDVAVALPTVLTLAAALSVAHMYAY
jgi:hypothetical protein